MIIGLIRFTACIAGMTCALGLQAQAPSARSGLPYPSRPIRLVVPFPPGGSSDSVARVVVQKFSEGLGQPVVIENRPGVGGLLGSEAVAKAAPDGYTLLLGSVSSLAVAPHLFSNPRIDPGKNFAAIAPIMSSPLTVIARPTLPVNSIADLVALARSKPGALNYGAAGLGTHVYLVAELFKKQAGFDAVHVPFQGGAPTMTALLAGNIDYKFDVVNTTLPQARAGRVKVLAVTSASRAPLMPEVPTLAESGFPGIEATAWVGVVGPAGLPAGIVSRLNAEIGNAVSSRDLSEVYIAQGVVPELASPSEFAEMIKREYARWGAVAKQVGAKPD
ncbi:MAG: tripartite tricarboxylate transporter substrate binding protein [Betaproteobacteria bacterium]|nr:MAG: tripartite tricarboxylate transporter substrate binding protein [Betaproteobacteria bacterium]